MPISFTQDRVGVHAKSVRDAALLLTFLRGFDPEDLQTSESLGKVDSTSYLEVLDEDGLVGARIGVLRDLFRVGDEFAAGNRLVEREVALMRENRALIVEGLSTGMDLVSMMPTLRVNNFELRFAYDAYLQRRGPGTPVKTLAELIATGRYLPDLDSRFQETMKRETLDYDAEYLGRLDTQRRLRDVLVELMDRHGLDALVYPFKALGAPPVGTADSGNRDNPISSVTGLPAVVMPAGLNEQGLPIAIEFLGRPFSEPTLLKLAYAYERVSRRRVAPPTTPHLPGEVLTYRAGGRDRE
jgi:Asp-tRNA(Asn)/Glu-tRNA(Gln) amidotransferase A subunit family amidase